jgi:DNA-binding NtrC family response regulator
MVSDGKFREDLFYRIAVSTILVPPLRERRSDIPALVEYMLAHIAQELHKPIDGIDRGALRRCTDYDWPGNVRELNNVLTRSVLLARGPLITEQLIMNAMGNSMPVVTASPGIQTLRNAEKDHVHKALLANDWNIKRTSEILDISRVTLRKKIEDYGLSRPESVHTEH